MLNTNTTEKLMAEGGLPQTSPQIPDNSKFEFESVYDFFSPPDTPEFNQIMDPQYENMLRQHAQQINTMQIHFNNPRMKKCESYIGNPV